jgi:tRNA nucleotidyltransferase (CCA-adding enzyme)
VLFPPSTPRAVLEDHGLALGQAVLHKPERRFAEHPYLAGMWEGLEAEVVPAYKVRDSSERMSAVDRTPFHTDYVVRNLGTLQRREVRLLKQFLLGIGAYGAEAKVQGFSGYLAEVLVLKYGTFRGVLRAAKDWRVGQLLALEPFEGAPRFPEPLVFIDPVDPTRNVASAVSLENLLLFQEAARAYLHEPRLGFFFPRPVQALPAERLQELLRKRGHGLVAARVERPDVLDDALHAQLRKMAGALEDELARSGWKVLGSAWHADARWASVAVELESLSINEREVHVGPPVDAGEHAERFRQKWTGNERALSAVYEEHGRLMVARRREFTNAAECLRARALQLDLGKDLTAMAKHKGFEALEQDRALRELDPGFLTRFLQHARPWER